MVELVVPKCPSPDRQSSIRADCEFSVEAVRDEHGVPTPHLGLAVIIDGTCELNRRAQQNLESQPQVRVVDLPSPDVQPAVVEGKLSVHSLGARQQRVRQRVRWPEDFTTATHDEVTDHVSEREHLVFRPPQSCPCFRGERAGRVLGDELVRVVSWTVFRVFGRGDVAADPFGQSGCELLADANQAGDDHCKEICVPPRSGVEAGE